jgi:sortase A
MTVTLDQTATDEVGPATGADGAAAPVPARTGSRVRPSAVLRAVGASVSLAALFLLGFAAYLYGLSGVAEGSGQINLRKVFTAELAAEVAPDGPTDEGKPVAILHLPRLGLTDLVVVEGTTGPDLTRGPGHRRDTVLPGQAGVSAIYGRAATFGAPFARIMDLRPGDRFTVTTAQGVSTFVVSSFGDGQHPAPADSPNRLVLTTADSSYVPRTTVTVNADLVGEPQPAPGDRRAPTAPEQALANDPDALVPLVLWAQAFLLVMIATVVAAARWARWPTYLCFTPVVVVAVWNVYENLGALLPNLY